MRLCFQQSLERKKNGINSIEYYYSSPQYICKDIYLSLHKKYLNFWKKCRYHNNENLFHSWHNKISWELVNCAFVNSFISEETKLHNFMELHFFGRKKLRLQKKNRVSFNILINSEDLLHRNNKSHFPKKIYFICVTDSAFCCSYPKSLFAFHAIMDFLQAVTFGEFKLFVLTQESFIQLKKFSTVEILCCWINNYPK